MMETTIASIIRLTTRDECTMSSCWICQVMKRMKLMLMLSYISEASRFSDHPKGSWCTKRSSRVSYTPNLKLGRHDHQKVSSFSLNPDGIEFR